MQITHKHPDYTQWNNFIQSIKEKYSDAKYNKVDMKLECYIFYIKYSNYVYHVGNKLHPPIYLTSDINQATKRFNSLVQNY